MSEPPEKVRKISDYFGPRSLRDESGNDDGEHADAMGKTKARAKVLADLQPSAPLCQVGSYPDVEKSVTIGAAAGEIREVMSYEEQIFQATLASVVDSSDALSDLAEPFIRLARRNPAGAQAFLAMLGVSALGVAREEPEVEMLLPAVQSAVANSGEVVPKIPTKVEEGQSLLRGDKSISMAVLEKVRGRPLTVIGWCRLSQMKGNKRDKIDGSDVGYVQVSFGGYNKTACLQQVILWSQGIKLNDGEQASHRCNRRKCTVTSHIVAEPETYNQNRKGCAVWVDCFHCDLKVFLCQHVPPCIKDPPPGFSGTEEDFLANSCHHREEAPA